MQGKTVAVIGGGIAGLAAAVRLTQLGYQVSVIEKRPFLGGRAYSFSDRETGLEIDNGQHVIVGACTEFVEYMESIGASDSIQFERNLKFPVILDGRTSWLQSRWLPGVIGNVAGLLTYKHLDFSDRLRVLRGLFRIRRTNTQRSDEFDQITFNDWLRNHGQNDRTIENFWNLIVLPALNDDIGAVSAEIGIELFKVALLGSTENPALGLPLEPLSELVGNKARAFLENKKNQFLLDSDVSDLLIENGIISGAVLANGNVVRADAIVAAIPPDALADLLPMSDSGEEDFFTPATRIDTAPIVAVHIWYDRPVMDEKLVAVLNSPLQWVFDDSAIKNSTDSSRHVVISLSGAWEWRHRSKSEIREIFEQEMRNVFPKAGTATIENFAVVKMAAATFRVTPGITANRLSQRTPLPGLYLAGDWTDTGWPSTMESAVRSGNLVAKYIDEDLVSSTP